MNTEVSGDNGGPVVVGCDIGGTFTDVVAVGDRSESPLAFKLLTTYPDPGEGVLEAVRVVREEFGVVRPIIMFHATTLVINALVQRHGARTSLVTNVGFKDVLELRRHVRNDVYDAHGDPPVPLIKRSQRLELNVRRTQDGRVLNPLDPHEVRRLIATLAASGTESVAVVFLHSYVAGDDEVKVGEMLREALPDLHISLSHEVLPRIKEYERTSTTVINAYVQPIVSKYISSLGATLNAFNSKNLLMIAESAGGMIDVETAAKFPVRIVESGGVAGVVAAQAVAKSLGEPTFLAFDMGGTTAKVCVVENGRIPISNDFEVLRVYRLRAGSGLPIATPTADIIEIGAGGGSIARIGERGLLSVGPESAGSDPGPVCYQRGGVSPTVTDANLVLGLLPEALNAKKLVLSESEARKAIQRQLAEPLGVSCLEAAWGIHNLVNETMASMILEYLAARGVDPRSLTMIATGGAGPVHAVGVATKLGMRRVIVPPLAGMGGAVGFHFTPIIYDAVASLRCAVDSDLAWAKVRSETTRLVDLATSRFMVATGQKPVAFTIEFEVCYIGQEQGVWLTVPWPEFEVSWLTMEQMTSEFEFTYRATYGHLIDDLSVFVLGMRATAESPSAGGATLRYEELPQARGATSMEFADYRSWYNRDDRKLVPVPILTRSQALAGAGGPAFIDEPDTTVVVPQGWSTREADHGSLVIES